MYRKNLVSIFKELETSDQGLSTEEVNARRERYGYNALDEKKGLSMIARFFLQFKDTLIIVLLVAATISLIVDITEWVDSLIILIVVIVNAVLGVIQEAKAEKSLAALKKMSSPVCKVLRDGITDTIDSKELIPGDIIFIEAGDFIPTDCRLIEAFNLKVDESALTGESVPVDKKVEVISDEVSLGDQHNMLFSSTYVTYGRGIAVVVGIGMNTEIGHIAAMLNESETKLTPLQHKLEQIGKTMGVLSIIICAIVFAMQMVAGETWIDAFKTAIALAVAAIPEGLATVVTIVLAIGVTRMSKQNAIVKKLPAVETLGCTSVVCSDKTGTLTQNKMTVVKVYNNGFVDFDKLDEKTKNIISYFALCSDAKISIVDGVEKRVGDPTETALIEFNMKHGLDLKKYQRLGELSFDSERKLMTVVVTDGKTIFSITKGAPDVLLGKTENDGAKDLAANEQMANEALRVLAVGIKKWDKMPEISIENLENDLTFLGMVGMIDPAREEVKSSIELAKRAHIKTIMITGDHVVTAQAIARNLGILGENDLAISSEELHKLTDEELYENIEKYSVYARVAPEDKVRIVEMWQRRGQIVAMTGDGVNDSPALKKSDIGCAMGITGTDVSKEAAAMILVDDNFSTIISAVKEGRSIYANIKKCVKYLLSSNIGEIITIFVASLITAFTAIEFGVPLLPIHLLWINLVTDSLPAFGLGMEINDDSIMNDAPRPKSEGFFANNLGLHIIIEGIFIGFLTILAYSIGNKSSHVLGQTMAFTTLSLVQLFHSYNVKSEKTIFNRNLFKNKFLNLAFILGLTLQMGVVYIPGVNDVFKVVPMGIESLLICVGLALGMVVIMEVYKLIKKILRIS